jgi:hypothetical protein
LHIALHRLPVRDIKRPRAFGQLLVTTSHYICWSAGGQYAKKAFFFATSYKSSLTETVNMTELAIQIAAYFFYHPMYDKHPGKFFFKK